MNRLSSGSVRLHDLLEASDDEYGFVRNRIESALDCREVTEEEILRVTPKPEKRKSKVSESEVGSLSSGETVASEKHKTEKDHDQSKFGVLLDKAKRKTQKLVTRKKSNSECAVTSDTLSVTSSAKSLESKSSPDEVSRQSSVGENVEVVQQYQPLTQSRKSNLVDPADPSDPFLIQSLVYKCRVLPFFRARIVIFGTLVALTISHPGFLTGLLWGFYTTIIGFLYFFVSEPKSKDDLWVLEEVEDEPIAEKSSGSEVDHAFGLGEGVVYRGWMNELRTRYSPASYHVNSSQSVLVRLEGSMLRICRPAKAVLKHAFYDDPTLKSNQHSMVSQVIYDLKDAQVSLRPKRLARRRWWSRKYPIYIKFAHGSSSLVEIGDKNQGMARSASMAPNPAISEFDVSDGYSPESETDAETEELKHDNKIVVANRMTRASSASDIGIMKTSKRCAKERGRSIFLFVRAAREKERWFHLLREACARARTTPTSLQKCASVIVQSRSSSSLPDDIKTDDLSSISTSVAIDALAAESTDFMSDTIFNTPKKVPRITDELEFLKYQSNYASFVREISKILSVQVTPKPEKGSTVSVDLGTMKWKAPAAEPQNGNEQQQQGLVESVNILATRIFFDFCRDEFWIRQVKQKIQGKLATIHLPYFIEKLELGELKFGTKAPTFTAVYTPKVDEWGTWIDFEMKYKGGIRLVLQTSVNLLKLQSGAMQVKTEKRVTRWTESVRATRYSDSSLPESPESSPDEDFGSKNKMEGNTKERTGKKILSIVERAAQSSFFQKAVKLHAVAKLIEDVSTTPLMLNVEVEELEGPMTCNIPPPPSDRLWYAFRRRPIFKIRAVPQVGDRSVDLSTVSEWIETKLRQVLEKNLVCPNMDDIILPVLSGNNLLHMGYNK